MKTPFSPKLGFDNYALRSLGWKAGQILDHAASLQLDAVLFSDFDVYDTNYVNCLVEVYRHG